MNIKENLKNAAIHEELHKAIEEKKDLTEKMFGHLAAVSLKIQIF